MEKNNKGLYILLVILFSLVIILSGYVLYDKVLINKVKSTPIEDKQNDNSQNSNNVIQNEIVKESDYIRKTKVTLYDENCTGGGTKLEAQIDEKTKNIAIIQSLGAIEIKIGNAKYLYSVGVIACDNYKLYYITDDKELYLLENPITETSVAKKVTNNAVVEFLGNEFKENDGEYLKVLLDNGNVEYIKYWSVPN